MPEFTLSYEEGGEEGERVRDVTGDCRVCPGVSSQSKLQRKWPGQARAGRGSNREGLQHCSTAALQQLLGLTTTTCHLSPHISHHHCGV